MDVEALKRAASARALEFVQPGMRLGLGTGSTARHFVDLLGERVAAGLDIVAVPTSEATRSQAERLGIKLTTLEEAPQLDLTVDGADEVSPDLTLIKGGGGALLREKIVATASARMIVIVDESKYVQVLGRFPLPIEIAPFGAAATHRAVEAAIAAAGCAGPASLRKAKDEQVFVTDGGHWILDAHLRGHSRSARARRSVMYHPRCHGTRPVHRQRPDCYSRDREWYPAHRAALIQNCKRSAAARTRHV
jgi:ribose 5-phosphate isomerase A